MSGDKTDIPLLKTKLHKPPVVTAYLHRQHLLDRLNRHRRRPMTLVSAPAGYGKSMLVSYWLETCGITGGWISLDENDNDLRSFMAYFIAAVERLCSGACRKTQTMIHSPNLPQLTELSSTLLNELDQIEQPCIIVLDDYHLIKETVVHDLLTGLLNSPPQSLHLVLIGRQDPPLPISTLRAKSLVTEVRAKDLCLDQHETAEFLRLILHQQIDSQTAATLREKTEGWITGLLLAAISLRHRDNPEPILLKAHSDAQYVMEYLFNEVYAKQSAAVRPYLLGSAILDRFCAPLCEVVCAPGTDASSCELGGWEYIAWLKKENLFLISLDPENRWFRYHHLFQSLLLNQLTRRYSSEEINALHARASAWFADEGMITEAIRHALAAGDESGAAQLAVQNRQTTLNAEGWFVFEKWLSMLPDVMIQQRPELLIAQVWIHYYHFNYGFIGSILDVAESLLSHQPEERPLYGEIYFFRAMFYLFQGNSALSFKFLENALEQIPETHHTMRGLAETYYGIAGQMHGQKERVVNVLTDLLHNQPMKNNRKVRVIAGLVIAYILSGDLPVAITLNQQLNTLAIRIPSSHYFALSSYLSGLIHYCRNELDLAIDHLSQAAELVYILLRRASADCMAALALAYQTAQQTNKAGATLERLITYAHTPNDSTYSTIANSCRTRLSLIKGEAPFSFGPAGINKAMNEEPMFFWLEIPSITRCRVLLEEGSDVNLQEAENRLQEYLRLCRTQHNTFQMIFILPLLALAHEKQGRPDEAATVLEEAVNMAGPGGFIRPFIEPGPELAGPLKRLAEKNIAVDYIGQILAAFSPPDHPPSSIAQTPDDLLTNRELDILEMLAQRLHNKEIAEKLFISAHTVNAHLKNIYRKLDVRNRRQAVARAKDLGII